MSKECGDMAKAIKFLGFSAASYVGKDVEKYAIVTEVNPWIPLDHLAKAMMYRGSIVSSWSYIDITLSEMAIRISKMDIYENIRDSYPYKAENKISYLRKVLGMQGPFSEIRSVGNQFLDRFEEAADIRHTMAHGKMNLLHNLSFSEFRTGKKGSIVRHQTAYTLAQLYGHARKATRLSRLLQMGYDAINKAHILPSMAE
jgi:hypothetical protein